MTKTPDGSESAAANAEGELAQSRQQPGQPPADPAAPERDVAEAGSGPRHSNPAQLLEVNEQLVLAMLRAQTEAEIAAQTLKEVSRSAEHDELTGLPNRVLLLDRLTHGIANAKRHSTRLALLFMDLDNFKQINDTLGHVVGDQVLKLVAHRLAASVREVDTVSRYGGDEFVVLLAEVAQPSDAVLIADKMLAALDVPGRVGDHVFRMTASIGISIYPEDGEDVAALIDRSDAAMYRAKRHGLGGFAFHAREATGELRWQSPAGGSLRQPVTHHELALAEHERRHAQLRAANEQLIFAALSAQELEASAEEAQRHQREFRALLGHELNNPLAPIRTAAALLGRLHTEEMPWVQAIIERQVAQITRLVGGLLDLSRANAGKPRLDRRLVDIAGIVEEAVDAIRPAMDARRQTFDLQTPSSGLEVDGDPARLVQVLGNLLDNASRFTPDGGAIGLSVAVVEDALEMTVSDSGIGITAETLPSVFEPFIQDTHAIGFSEAGLGIGLAVVRELVKAHGGNVVASSAGTGRGSRFVVTLPLARVPTVRQE